VPIVDPAFWNDLGRHILDWGAQPNEYLLPWRTVRPNRQKPGEKFVIEYRDAPMGVHGLHKWRILLGAAAEARRGTSPLVRALVRLKELRAATDGSRPQRPRRRYPVI
jgi:hypothetical protein